MEVESLPCLQGLTRTLWETFLRQAGLEADTDVEQTVLVWDSGTLIATGSRKGNLLKCIAVDAAHQGEGLTATVLTSLRQEAFQEGYRHLFLYTKPQNKAMFSSLFFHPVAQTDQVLLMEDRPNGIQSFLQALPAPVTCGRIGAAVMNCNPFTLGHRYLIEQAAKECDWLYIFVLSEDRSRFSASDRMAMVENGTRGLANVTVLPTGPYLISSTTFPTYFLKEREKAQTVQCRLDIQIFTKYYVPKFGISRRYVGTEPLSPMTNQYNEALAEFLPQSGIELRILPRLEQEQTPVSASAVRALLDVGNPDAIRSLVPQTTYDYLLSHDFLSE